MFQSATDKSNESLLRALDSNEDHIIIEGFMERYSINREDAEEILQETKKWLWLASENIKEKKRFRLFIDSSLLIIDEMWHNFILHTRSYQKFCNDKLNLFVHHEPTLPSAKVKGFDSDVEKQKFEKHQEEKLSQQLSYIYDKLGAETVSKWYEEYPEKFSKEKLKALKR
ncbi:hypothetical protein MATR_25140 [Marivirga tractuosa]|uniref:Uncharacterized protein n=1 Tax=Marivirga tractuosa (strain ATCC 23168 / DSM 4126 / NBRC 15989 / NCIMB 1408 / VKM B-1430 / H-43) TaxID=643867 RepID=E4TPU3_MARTH|nr:hypothetical protein [Marivirga tractuosa]ADR23630.1 hypothetical protein Ftrac_3661 [Marivirga tractuosa DSM 4126]BDD15689.1 hypothetical protein MATR_25140 [Marivirga tractuosa]